MSEPAILAIDLGSSSARASLWDRRGDPIGETETQISHEFRHTPDEGVVADADELVDLIARAVDGTLEKAPDAPVQAVAISTFWHSVLGVDSSIKPTTPVLTWADRRAAGADAALREPLDGREAHRRSGRGLHCSYVPAQLVWLRGGFREAFVPPERGDEGAERAGVGPADPQLLGGAATAAGRPPWDRRGRHEEHLEPARGSAADDLVVGVPRPGGIGRGIARVEAGGRTAGRGRGRDPLPEDERADGVRAEAADVVEGGVPGVRPLLEELRVVLDDRLLGGGGERRRAEQQEGRDGDRQCDRQT